MPQFTVGIVNWDIDCKKRGKNVSKLTFLHLDALGFEQFAKLLDFLLELADELRVGVLVDDGLADDLFGTVRVSGKRKEKKKNDIFMFPSFKKRKKREQILK